MLAQKRVFLVENGKIALVRASMVVTYNIKLFRMGADRQNGILMSLILLVAETITTETKISSYVLLPQTLWFILPIKRFIFLGKTVFTKVLPSNID